MVAPLASVGSKVDNVAQDFGYVRESIGEINDLVTDQNGKIVAALIGVEGGYAIEDSVRLVRDYYALAGLFASTQMTDRPLLPSPLAEQIVEARQNVDKMEEALKAIKDKESDEAKKLIAEIDSLC